MTQRYDIEIPDSAYWKRQIKCQNACPVHTDARGYVRAIAEGDYEKAYLIARAPNPLASICGRICGAPCEAACRRGDLDEAVSIRALKRFVTERFGVESEHLSGMPLDKLKNYISGANSDCSGLERFDNYLSHFKNTHIPDDAPTVGIIGSGPAGLAAAHDLCLMGVKPIIYEMEPVPAGMLYLGVPEYRLPRDLIRAEVEVIKMLGTEIRCNIQVGKDITLKELRKRHDAVLISVGAKKSRKLPLPNIDAPGVFGGVDFLRDVALGEPVEVGGKLAVIGGGNVAYDVARTLIRQAEYDVSRTALRQRGVEEVHLFCLESLEEMPADTAEIEEGEEEGVVRHNSWGPREILVDGFGHARGVRFVRCLSVFDAGGRFAPKFDENQILDFEADNVLLSVGQSTDLSFIDSQDIALDERGQLKLDATKNLTEGEGVFAAGDVATGPGLMIHAIASGKEAARQIYSYLRNRTFATRTLITHIADSGYRKESGYELLEREGVPAMSPEERKRAMNVTVEKGFSEGQAIRQGSRCFNCAVNTIFDGDKCILCGGCADVCPEACLKLVSVGALMGTPEFDALLDLRYGEISTDDYGAIIKDETICIRCGLCAERCPVGAITMEVFNFKEMFA
jgi:NADPH-dependent glutamate synthase beta subunit-like oxidoreductase/NAD-dependent dihydropyrimidine dehydrogenase PreA subunit